MAGLLNRRVTILKAKSTLDAYGAEVVEWSSFLVCYAEFVHMRGTETVDAARLQGREIFKVKLRRSAKSAEISTEDRLRDERVDQLFQIRSVDAISNQRWIFLVVESGVAA